jgi:amino acid adenylation domain-containing protein
LQGETLDSQLAYWREKLTGAPPSLELPTDRPRPPVQTHEGAAASLMFSESLSQELIALSRREGATLFMTLLAAWQTLLSRYSGQTDIVVGSPIAGRNRAESEALIGFFANTLALRTDLSGDPSFLELLRRVKEVALGAYAYQDVPFELLVEDLQPARDISRSPLFQVTFTLHNAPVTSLEFSELQLSLLEVKNQIAKFDLGLHVDEGHGDRGLLATLEYNTDLYDRATVERLLGNFETLLAAIVRDPRQRLSSLPLLTTGERHQLLFTFNDTATDYPNDLCIQQQFEHQVERTPDEIALVFGERKLTYSELNERANRLAHHLREMGIGPEVPVGICLERSVELIVGLLGILKAGGAYLPLDPGYPMARLSFMLEDAAIPVLVTTEARLNELPSFWGQPVCMDADHELIEAQSAENPPCLTSAENLAYVIYTSGSTGEPKGVSIQHRSVLRLVCSNPYIEFSPCQTFLQLAPVSFDASTLEIWGALLHGSRLVLMPPESPTLSELAAVLRTQQVTTLWLTAGMFHMMVDEQLEELAGVQQLLAGGDVLSVGHVRRYLARMREGQRLVNGYGPTEGTTFTCCHVMEKGAEVAGSVPIGRPIRNTKVYVLDAGMEIVPVGVVGELYVGGDGLARDYLKRAELTAERFVPDPYSEEAGARLYRTGDEVRYLSEGEIEFIGRRDAQVKVRGFRIELGEIEAIIAKHPSVLQTVVVARADDTGDKRLTAYVVLKNGTGPNTSEWHAYLKQRVPDYMLPGSFMQLAMMPLTANGKVDRRALPEADGARPELKAAPLAPRTPTEEIVAGIWMEVLAVKEVGVDDDFFELGGHSLLATQVISWVREAFAVEINLRVMFEQPTVAGLALNIELALKRGDESARPAIEQISRGGDLPLSFAQQRLWFLDQLEPDNAFYNVPVAVRLSGQLDTAALEQTISEIVRRHEVLRTSFAVRNGQVTQVINDAEPISLSPVDLSSLSEPEREAAVRRLTAEEAHRPFDLSASPLLRVTLLRLADDEHVVMVVMHHVVADGWSMGVLVREIGSLYESFSRGQPPGLDELPLQYADFASWQRSWLQGAVLDSQLSYWKRQLAGAPPLLKLPTDRPYPPIQSFRGATVTGILNAGLSADLEALSRQEGATLFMMLLAAWQTLLSRYSGQTDIVVGSPIANRNHAETESLIGFFVNTLALRTDLSGDPRFRELLRRVREVTLGAYAHQDLPFELLVEELQPERDLGHTPLFQVVFTLQNAPLTSLQFAALSLSPLTVENKTAKFDLGLNASSGQSGLVISLEYNTDLYDEITIKRLLDHLQALLGSIVAQPDARLSALDYSTEADTVHRSLEKRKREDARRNKFRTVRPQAVSLS